MSSLELCPACGAQSPRLKWTAWPDKGSRVRFSACPMGLVGDPMVIVRECQHPWHEAGEVQIERSEGGVDFHIAYRSVSGYYASMLVDEQDLPALARALDEVLNLAEGVR